jgi:hypothetical protein
MNKQTLPTADASNDWLDAMLRAEGREHRAAYLDDDGFTARVMSGLPAPATLPAWRKPALTALWAGAGLGIALALPAAVVDVAHEALRVILGQQVSLTGIAAGVAALGAATWAAAAIALHND